MACFSSPVWLKSDEPIEGKATLLGTFFLAHDIVRGGHGQPISFTGAYNILGCDKFMLSLLAQVAECSGDKAGHLLGREQRTTCEK